MNNLEMIPENAKGDAGPLALVRWFLVEIRKLGVVSTIYHFSHRFNSIRSSAPYLHFETGLSVSKNDIPEDYADAFERCHEYIIKLGKPIVLSEYLSDFIIAEPRITQELMAEANRLGMFDQYMIPVFGPFHITGVISLGFAETIDGTNVPLLRKLESLATTLHNQLVRHFAQSCEDVELSQRESEVLSWIAKGKSSGEIATILGVSRNSVDTYTRRIFAKLQVNDRVSAAVNAVIGGIVKPN